jgi:hypothetical protein
MFTVTLVTAQCGCGEQDVASSIDGRPVRVPAACKAGHDVVVLPIYGTRTYTAH